MEYINSKNKRKCIFRYDQGIDQKNYCQQFQIIRNSNSDELIYMVILNLCIITKGMYIVLFLIITSAKLINQKCDHSLQFSQNTQRNQETNKCPQNSHCLPDNICQCDRGFIGNCQQRAFFVEQDKTLSTVINYEDYTFFQITQVMDRNLIQSLTICQNQTTQLLAIVDFWSDNGKLESLTKANAKAGGKAYNVSGRCLNLMTQMIKVKNKSNDRSENIIVGIKTSSPGSLDINLTINCTRVSIQGQILQLFLIIGGCIFLTLSISAGYVTYKLKRIKQSSRKQDNNLEERLEKLMPAFKLKNRNKNKNINQICSICLTKFGSSYIRQTQCQHMFHKLCLDEWCKKKINCPICRHSFYKQVQENQQFIEANQEQPLREVLMI